MQNGRIILVVSGKGGSGKSTFSVNCASALAKRGRKVLLVDADTGLRSLDLMLGISDRVNFDMGDVLEGRCETGKAIIVTDCHDLHLLPASASHCEEMQNSEVISKLYRGLAFYYDYVFVDSSAGIDSVVTAPAPAADMTVVVSTPDSVCIRDAGRVSGILRSFGAQNIRLVLNRVQPKLIRKKIFPNLDEAIDSAACRLLGVVPEDKHISLCAEKGKSVLIFKNGAAQAFFNMASRIDGEDVPLMKL
jgi:septum site-determining protein MinD